MKMKNLIIKIAGISFILAGMALNFNNGAVSNEGNVNLSQIISESSAEAENGWGVHCKYDPVFGFCYATSAPWMSYCSGC